MAGTNTRFEEFLASEIKRYRGVYIPVKAGILRRALVRKLVCSKIHPNPDDEFCMPGIGPNYEIISRYETEIRDARMHSQKEDFKERLIVEKIRPDGYMLLNGHHRWAAAVRSSLRSVPVKVVNLTNESDVKRTLEKSTSTKRVTMDLDEVVMAGEGAAEKNPGFSFGSMYREKIRLGIPALSRYLNNKGYDLWVYSAEYHSPEYIQQLFRRYHVHVKGIVTGAGRKRKGEAETQERMNRLFENHYTDTYHIDERAVVHINSGRKEFEEFPLSGEQEAWSGEIMDVFDRFTGK